MNRSQMLEPQFQVDRRQPGRPKMTSLFPRPEQAKDTHARLQELDDPQTQTLCTLAVLKDGGMQHTPVGSADKSSYSLGVSTSLQP